MQNKLKNITYALGALLIGLVICISLWFFLREYKAKKLQENGTPTVHNNRGTTKNSNTKGNLTSIYTEEQLALPFTQDLLTIMDSPEFKEHMKSRPTIRMTNDFLESQGFSVPQDGFIQVFRVIFPTGEPADYEPEMRVKIAQMFLDAEPVDLTDSVAAAKQRSEVLLSLHKDRRAFGWFLAQFQDEDWEHNFLPEPEDIGGNSALEWVSAVQQKAADIVAAAETVEVNTSETPKAATPWDLSSVIEGPTAFPDEMERDRPTTVAPLTDADEQYDTEKRTAATPMADPEKIVTNALSTVLTPPTVEQVENALREQFSSERFGQAMDTLERYGPEEGLRRLRENDPEVASQIEQHRNRSRSEDSDTSKEEVSR